MSNTITGDEKSGDRIGFGEISHLKSLRIPSWVKADLIHFLSFRIMLLKRKRVFICYFTTIYIITLKRNIEVKSFENSFTCKKTLRELVFTHNLLISQFFSFPSFLLIHKHVLAVIFFLRSFCRAHSTVPQCCRYSNRGWVNFEILCTLGLFKNANIKHCKFSMWTLISLSITRSLIPHLLQI